MAAVVSLAANAERASSTASRGRTLAVLTGARSASNGVRHPLVEKRGCLTPLQLRMLIKGMTEQEIRVLQEFRRLTTETMPLTTIKTIKHPFGGGEAPAFSLVQKGYLSADDARQNFTLTQKAKDFLAYDPKPEFEEPSAASAEEVTE